MTDLLDPALDWLAGLNGAYPRPVEEQARLLLLDTLGCLIAGMDHPAVREFSVGLARSFPGGHSWPGGEDALTPAGSAALGALAACWDEACEGLASAHGRPGLPVAPTVLALGRDLPLSALIDALIVGYEIGGRMGQAWPIKPGMHVDGGYHAVGVAAAVARLRGGSAQALRDAISAAVCQLPSSLYLPITQGSSVRNLYPAHAVLLGALTGEAAAAGMSGPSGAAEQARKVVLGLEGVAEVAPPEHFLLLDGYLKPFAAVRHVHYGVTAALRMRVRLPDPTAIRAIRLTVYEEAARYCGNRDPQTVIQAQFSLSYGVAAALVFGDLAPESYRDLFHPELRRLEALVEVVVDPNRSNRSAHLAISTDEETLGAESGDLPNVMPPEKVVAKFTRYASPVIGRDRALLLATAILNGDWDAPLRWE